MVNVVVAVLALVVAGLYVIIALAVVPRLAKAATDGERSNAIAIATIGAATFLLGCAVTHVVIAYLELSARGEHHSDTTVDVIGHVIPHVLQVAGGVAFIVVARRRLSVYVVRKDDSQRIAELEGRLSYALDEGHLGAWDVDLATGRTWHSAQHDRVFGYTTPPTDWSFDVMLDHVIDDHRHMVEAALALDHARPRTEFDCQIVTADGSTRWVNITATLLFDQAGEATRVLGTVADITDRREREAQRAALEEQLHSWQRVEAIGRLASGVAHDFNNVLAVVHGWAELLERDPALPDTARGRAREILSAADHGRRLTQQLAEAARHHPTHEQQVDVNDTVEHVASMLERLVPASVHVHSHLADGLSPVYTDPTQLLQILINLGINARDAIPEGGNIDFTTRASDGSVEIDVCDDGVGMSADTMSRIFEPYFSTKAGDADTGSGLGLAIVQSLVQRAGGTITPTSTLGAGTTFALVLPAMADAGAVSPTPS